MYKICKSCLKEKEIFFFRKQRCDCKECEKKKLKLYREKNKEKLKERRLKKYIKKERKIITEEERMKRRKESLYKYNNSEKRKKVAYKYNNSEKRRLYLKEWQKNKRNKNEIYKIHQSISANLRNSLNKGFSFYKNLFGYDAKDLKLNLEKQFIDGMSWNNYGKWEIDHIIPVNIYNINDIGELKKCWSLRNLRPLWKKDNILKKDKIILEEIKKYNIIDLLPEEYKYIGDNINE